MRSPIRQTLCFLSLTCESWRQRRRPMLAKSRRFLTVFGAANPLLFGTQSWTSTDWVPKVYSTKLADAIKLVLSKLQDFTFSSSASSKQLTAGNNAPLRALAWHHSRQVIAMAHRQDSVHIYDLVSEKWLPPPPSGLKHDFQKDVTAIEWNPQLGTLLAVTSRFGVCLWRLVFDPPPSSYHAPNGVPDFIDDSSACHGWMSLLRFPGCEQINVIAWSPDGKFLAAGSRESSTMLVWDVATETATPFGTRGRGTRSLGTRTAAGVRMGAARVKWPSDATNPADSRDVIRIYETRTWAFQTLNTQKLRPHSVCWMPDSKMFMFAVETGRSIVVQQLNRPAPALGKGEKPAFECRVSAQIKQVTRFRMPDFHSETHDLSIGGKVKSLAIDPTGKRLAVCFDGEHRGAELIALFAMTNRPMPDIELT
ncbi:WD40-repeat-containing domain protein [Geranomyces variabilis]|nr:WD40-repeat-containing domain protein [Geranomyces variabilis]